MEELLQIGLNPNNFAFFVIILCIALLFGSNILAKRKTITRKNEILDAFDNKKKILYEGLIISQDNDWDFDKETESFMRQYQYIELKEMVLNQNYAKLIIKNY